MRNPIKLQLSFPFPVLITSPQLADDMSRIRKQLKKQDDLDPEQHDQIIWLLWQRNQAVTQRLTEIEIPLESLDIDSDNISQGLKVCTL